MVARDNEKVGRLLEAAVREVQGSHEGRPFVGHDVLGVVFHGRVGVAPHPHAELFQQDAQQPEARSIASAAGEQRFDPHAPPAGRTERVEHLAVVAAVEREDEPALRRGDHFQHRRTPPRRCHDNVVHDHSPFFEASQDTDLSPADPPFKSAALTSSIEEVDPRTAR